MRDFIGLYWRGMIMGTADLIPGVSGGTMAFILGIYERLMQALKSLNGDAFYHFVTFKWDKVWQEVDFKTLAGVAAGIVTAIGLLVYVLGLSSLIASYKAQIYGFFFGLVFATVIIFLTQQNSAKFIRLLTLAIGFAIGLTLTSMELSALPNTKLFIFASGMIAICAMLLPGISGSYLLLMLGKYELILRALETLDWTILSLFICGMLVGMLAFVRLLSWLLKEYHTTMLMLITGLIAGTLPQLWPLSFMPVVTLQGLGIVGGCVLAGIAFITTLHWLQVNLSD